MSREELAIEFLQKVGFEEDFVCMHSLRQAALNTISEMKAKLLVAFPPISFISNRVLQNVHTVMNNYPLYETLVYAILLLRIIIELYIIYAYVFLYSCVWFFFHVIPP